MFYINIFVKLNVYNINDRQIFGIFGEYFPNLLISQLRWVFATKPIGLYLYCHSYDYTDGYGFKRRSMRQMVCEPLKVEKMIAKCTIWGIIP